MTKKQILNIILIGPQGSGKGTQAKLLARKFRLAHVEMGGMLRDIAKTKTRLGRQLDEIVNKKGGLVPHELILKVVKEKLKSLSPKQGIVFDGIPRSLVQAKLLEKVLTQYNRKLTHSFYLPIREKTTLKRLVKRRICKKCGKLFVYGLDIHSRSKKCPKCGGQIIQRQDDKPEAIKKRLSWFYTKVLPVIEYYRKKGTLIEVNGEQPVKKIFKDILSHL